MRSLMTFLLLGVSASASTAQTYATPHRGAWVLGPQMNRHDVTGDAVTAATLNIGGSGKEANLLLGCKAVDGGQPVIELRAMTPAFPGSQQIATRAQLEIGDYKQSTPLDAFPAGQQVVFVIAATPPIVAALKNADANGDIGGVSIAFQAGGKQGMISTDLPSRNSVLDQVFGACGLHTSSGQSASSAASKPSVPIPAAMTSSSGALTPASTPYPYTIKGIGLRMTRAQVKAVALKMGVTHTYNDKPDSFVFATRDLGWNITFDKSGLVQSYELETAKYLNSATENSGPLYDLAVSLFGPKSGWGDHVTYFDGNEAGMMLSVH